MDELTGELLKLGFGEKKAGLYLALLRLGKGSAARLAEAAGIKRTTAYELLEELCAENLASISAEGNRRYFLAESPDWLSARLARQQQALTRVLPELTRLTQAGRQPLRVRYFEGMAGSIHVHEELLRRARGEYFYFGSMETFLTTTTREYGREWVARRIAKGIWSNALLIADGSGEGLGELEAGVDNLRRVRYLPRDTELPIANAVLFDGRIAIFTGLRDNCSMLIDCGDLYSLMMLLWRALWRVSPESVGGFRQKKS